MASHGDSVKAPPKFDGLIGKLRMIVFLKFLGRDVIAITKEFKEPDSNEAWSESTTKAYEANAKATYAIMQALNDDDSSAYEIWNDLIITHEGTPK